MSDAEMFIAIKQYERFGKITPCAECKYWRSIPDTIYGTSCTNYDGQDAVCLFEFVVDWTKLPRIVKDAGTFTVLPQFGGLYGDGGNIVKLTKIGRWWKP